MLSVSFAFIFKMAISETELSSIAMWPSCHDDSIIFNAIALSFVLALPSTVPTASILGGPDLHFDKGLYLPFIALFPAVCCAMKTLCFSVFNQTTKNPFYFLVLFCFIIIGSTINLTCTIKYSPEPPAYIFWYHHDEVINVAGSAVNLNDLRAIVGVLTESRDE